MLTPLRKSRLVQRGVTKSPTCGVIFQRLIADRKNSLDVLHPSRCAALMAGLAIPFDSRAGHARVGRTSSINCRSGVRLRNEHS